MKKYMVSLLVMAVTLLAVAPLHAEGMMFGVKGGLDLANLTGDAVALTKIKTGMAGGAFFSYNFTEIFAIQPELLFAMKGAAIDIPIIDASLKANYLEIPILFKVNFPTEGKIKPNLYAGPALGILMSAKASLLGVDIDLKDVAKSTNFGIVAGGGVGYQLEEKGLLFLEVRYEVGLTTIAKDVKFATKISTSDLIDLEDVDVDEDAIDFIKVSGNVTPDIKTSDISIMVGYGFSF